MENQNDKSTTVQGEWMGETFVAENDDQNEVVVKECACLFD